jgi:hypothetical protein
MVERQTEAPEGYEPYKPNGKGNGRKRDENRFKVERFDSITIEHEGEWLVSDVVPGHGLGVW